MNYYMRVVIEKTDGKYVERKWSYPFFYRVNGWQIRVTDTNWLNGDNLTMRENGYFAYGSGSGKGEVKIYPSRKLAREDLRRYMEKYDFIKITGGLH